MIKVEVIEDFTLQKYDELQNVQRKAKEIKGKLFVGDTFECTEEMAKYLTGDNPLGKVVVTVIEYEPKEETPIEQPKPTKKKKSKK